MICEEAEQDFDHLSWCSGEMVSAEEMQVQR